MCVCVCVHMYTFLARILRRVRSARFHVSLPTSRTIVAPWTRVGHVRRAGQVENSKTGSPDPRVSTTFTNENERRLALFSPAFREIPFPLLIPGSVVSRMSALLDYGGEKMTSEGDPPRENAMYRFAGAGQVSAPVSTSRKYTWKETSG